MADNPYIKVTQDKLVLLSSDTLKWNRYKLSLAADILLLIESLTLEERVITAADFYLTSFRDCEIKYCIFDNCDFKKALLNKCTFSECIFKNCRFDDSKLEKCVFTNSALQGNSFNKAQLTHCDLRGLEGGDDLLDAFIVGRSLPLSFASATLKKCINLYNNILNEKIK